MSDKREELLAQIKSELSDLTEEQLDRLIALMESVAELNK